MVARLDTAGLLKALAKLDTLLDRHRLLGAKYEGYWSLLNPSFKGEVVIRCRVFNRMITGS